MNNTSDQPTISTVIDVESRMGGTGNTLAEFYANGEKLGFISPTSTPRAEPFLKAPPAPFKFAVATGEQSAHSLLTVASRVGMTFNPVAAIGEQTDWCLLCIQTAARFELDEARYAAARRIALDLANESEPSVRSLIDAWRGDRTLADFADAVANAMLPV